MKKKPKKQTEKPEKRELRALRRMSIDELFRPYWKRPDKKKDKRG